MVYIPRSVEWICEWCEYPNTNANSCICEVCREKSTLAIKHPDTPKPVPEPISKLVLIPTVVPVIDVPEYKEYNRKSPVIKPDLPKAPIQIAPAPMLTESDGMIDFTPLSAELDAIFDQTDSIRELSNAEPSAESKCPLIKQTIETIPIVAKSLVNDKVYSEHVCFMDSGNINCIICNKPMVLAMAAGLKYPDWLPTGLNDKISHINDMIDESMFYSILVDINGGAIPEMEAHMECDSDTTVELGTFVERDMPTHISIKCSSYSKARYRGPTTNALAAACRAALEREHPIVIFISFSYPADDEFGQLLIITPPEKNEARLGRIHVLDSRFRPTFVTDGIINSLVDDINVNLTGEIYWLVIPHTEWIQKASLASKIMFSATYSSGPLAVFRASHLTIPRILIVASILCSGMTLLDLLDMFGCISTIDQMNKLLDIATSRILSQMFKELI